MHHGDERDVRALGYRFPQRRRALRGELRDQLVGPGSRGLTAFRHGPWPGLTALRAGRLILLPDEAALHPHASLVAERHERAARRDVRRVMDRLTLQGPHLCLKLIEARLHGLGHLLVL